MEATNVTAVLKNAKIWKSEDQSFILHCKRKFFFQDRKLAKRYDSNIAKGSKLYYHHISEKLNHNYHQISSTRVWRVIIKLLKIWRVARIYKNFFLFNGITVLRRR
jgi:hypothetical protein